MEITRTKLTLIVVGSVFVGMALVIVIAAGWLFIKMGSDTPSSISFGGEKGKSIASAGDIAEEKRYLGSQAVFFGRASNYGNDVLVAGDSLISGRVMRAGKPLLGLKVQLLLNEKVASQWAVSDANGVYNVSVPAGQYLISGYKLDSGIANELLAGMIMHPEQHRAGQQSEPMSVAPGKLGTGLDFSFAAPVVLIEPSGVVTGGANVKASWEAYPGAVTYRLQLEERLSERNYESIKFLPEYSPSPQVTTSSVDLSTIGVTLKSGHFYILHIEALDKSGEPISRTVDSYRRRGFVMAATN